MDEMEFTETESNMTDLVSDISSIKMPLLRRKKGALMSSFVILPFFLHKLNSH